MAYFKSFSISDGANLDAFSNLRVSTPVTLFDSDFYFDLQSMLYSQGLTSGGTITHVPNYSSAQLAVTSTTGSQSILISKQHWRYQKGRSQLIKQTQIFGTKVANVVKRAGYFDVNDGIFFEVNGTTDLAFTLRTSTSGSASDTNRVAQSAWNLDKLDGTGPSGITLDVTKSQILIIDLQWLGMGRVRVGFDIDGAIVYCHQFLNANRLLSVPYMKTANLPVRWEVTNNAGGAGDNTFYATCVAVASEGGFETERALTFAAANTADITVANGTRTAVIAIRPKSTFNSISTKGALLIPTDFSFLAGTSPCLIELIYDPTLATAGSWVSANANSLVEYNITATVTAGTGTVVDSIFINGSTGSVKAATNNQLRTRLPFCVDPLTGAQPVFMIVATGVGGTSASRAAINWLEIR